MYTQAKKEELKQQVEGEEEKALDDGLTCSMLAHNFSKDVPLLLQTHGNMMEDRT